LALQATGRLRWRESSHPLSKCLPIHVLEPAGDDHSLASCAYSDLRGFNKTASCSPDMSLSNHADDHLRRRPLRPKLKLNRNSGHSQKVGAEGSHQKLTARALLPSRYEHNGRKRLSQALSDAFRMVAFWCNPVSACLKKPVSCPRDDIDSNQFTRTYTDLAK
jgi:hypothetical protein